MGDNDLDLLSAMLDDLSFSTPQTNSQNRMSAVPTMDDLNSLMNELAGGNQELHNMLGKKPERQSLSVSSQDLAALMNDLGGPTGSYGGCTCSFVAN